MDTDWTFSSCSWLWEDDSEFKNECAGSHWTKEEDKVFEDGLALYHNDPDGWDKIASAIPGKSIQDLKLHYEALSGDVLAIESGNVPLPHYQSNDNDHEKKRKTMRGVNRGIPWTEEEHRRFLDGLEKYGRGDWKSIARFSVQTKSNSQVASHAQKYFKRLNSTSKEGKRHSINDVTLPAVHKPTTTIDMPRTNDCELLNVGKQLMSPAPVGSMFDSSFSSQSIQEPDLVGMSTYYPPLPPCSASFDFPSFLETELLMMQDDCGAPAPSSFGVPSIHEIPSLVQDDVVPNFRPLDFPCTNDVQPSMQGVSSAYEIQQPSAQEIGISSSSSSGIPPWPGETVDPDIFVLPHFLDID